MTQPVKKVFKGIRINSCNFQGEIVSDPVTNGGYSFLTLRTKDIQKDQNGQYVELDQDVPLMVEPGGPTAVLSYIRAGRRLMAWCTYKSWENQGVLNHAFVVKNFDLGDKPYEPTTDAGQAPDLPY